MKQILPVLLFLVSTFSFGQKSEYRPFKMIIVSPDTAVVDNELKNFADTIESNYVKRYYNSMKQMEDFLTFNDYPDDMKKQFEEIQVEFIKEIIVGGIQLGEFREMTADEITFFAPAQSAGFNKPI